MSDSKQNPTKAEFSQGLESLRDVALFVEVASSGGFSAAARKLDIPVSSLSRRIAELEMCLGVQLLNRTTRRVELTEIGQRYYLRCKAAVEEANAARNELLGIDPSLDGSLRISVDPRLVAAMSLAAVEMTNRHPKVALQFETAQTRSDLYVCCSFEGPEIQAHNIGTIDVGLYASEDYLASRGAPENPGDLRLHDLIFSNEETTWELSKDNQLFEVPESPRIRGPIDMLPSMAHSGLGIARLNTIAAERYVSSGLLVPVIEDWKMRPLIVWIDTPSRILSARALAFITAAQESLLNFNKREPEIEHSYRS